MEHGNTTANYTNVLLTGQVWLYDICLGKTFTIQLDTGWKFALLYSVISHTFIRPCFHWGQNLRQYIRSICHRFLYENAYLHCCFGYELLNFVAWGHIRVIVSYVSIQITSEASIFELAALMFYCSVKPYLSDPCSNLIKYGRVTDLNSGTKTSWNCVSPTLSKTRHSKLDESNIVWCYNQLPSFTAQFSLKILAVRNSLWLWP